MEVVNTDGDLGDSRPGEKGTARQATETRPGSTAHRARITYSGNWFS